MGLAAVTKDWKGASSVKRRRSSHHQGMSSDGNPRITLELEAGADPIRGTIDHGDGSRLQFWGWLELMEELRRVAAGEPTRPPSQPSPTGIGQAAKPDAPTKTAQ
jgi:hypothetical protein